MAPVNQTKIKKKATSANRPNIEVKTEQQQWEQVVKDLRQRPERVMALIPSPLNDPINT